MMPKAPGCSMPCSPENTVPCRDVKRAAAMAIIAAGGCEVSSEGAVHCHPLVQPAAVGGVGHPPVAAVEFSVKTQFVALPPCFPPPLEVALPNPAAMAFCGVARKNAVYRRILHIPPLRCSGKLRSGCRRGSEVSREATVHRRAPTHPAAGGVGGCLAGARCDRGVSREGAVCRHAEYIRLVPEAASVAVFQ